MKQFKGFASKFRIKTLLCSSAVVLLTACGGNIETGSEQLSATAASVTTDAAENTAAPTIATNTEPAVEAVAEPAPAASAEAAPSANTEAVAAITKAANAAGATAQTEKVSTQAFELSGYDSTPSRTQTEQQDAAANVRPSRAAPL